MDRSGKELLIASKQYAVEHRLTSWWHLVSTASLLILLMLIPIFHHSWIASISSSILAGFVMVRMFVLYHDYYHGAILRNSRLAKWLMASFGMLVLSPPSMWKSSHDDHHKNNCKSFGEEIGSFPVMTTDSYASAPLARRIGYQIVRNPLIIVFGYLTSFFWNKSLRNFLKHPVRNRMAGFSILLHFGLLILIGCFSIKAMLLGILVPVFIGSGVGTYLFYAQHNFPGMKRKEGEDWDYVYAALKSSSFLKTSHLMNWLTGNIGFHHVHHLNSRIPFYRLPEAMAGMQELQNPESTSLKVVDVYRCLRLKLWDPRQKKLLSFREARHCPYRTSA